jgi:hypothetical protein
MCVCGDSNGAPVDAGSASGVDAPLEVRDGDSERAGDVGPVSVEGVLDVAATGPDGETDGADTNTERRAARENEGGWHVRTCQKGQKKKKKKGKKKRIKTHTFHRR